MSDNTGQFLVFVVLVAWFTSVLDNPNGIDLVDALISHILGECPANSFSEVE